MRPCRKGCPADTGAGNALRAALDADELHEALDSQHLGRRRSWSMTKRRGDLRVVPDRQRARSVTDVPARSTPMRETSTAGSRLEPHLRAPREVGVATVVTATADNPFRLASHGARAADGERDVVRHAVVEHPHRLRLIERNRARR